MLCKDVPKFDYDYFQTMAYFKYMYTKENACLEKLWILPSHSAFSVVILSEVKNLFLNLSRLRDAPHRRCLASERYSLPYNFRVGASYTMCFI